MSSTASFLPELQIDLETPWPAKRDGKQVYAKLIDFGAFPAPFGLRAKTHGIQNIGWKQISWDHSYVSKSSEGEKRSLALVATPELTSGMMPWRFLIDDTSVQVNMLVNKDYRDWDRIVLCLLYTRADEGAQGGSLIVPGPDGAVLASNGGALEWVSPYGGLSREEVRAMIEASRYELCEFYFFRHPDLRPGFMAANGQLITDAATRYPEAWAYLQSTAGQKICKTEAVWQTMSTATWATLANGAKIGWSGIGGVPFYALNTETGTLRLPDLRGMYAEVAGFDGLGVGGVHGDGARRVTASWVTGWEGAYLPTMFATGALYAPTFKAWHPHVASTVEQTLPYQALFDSGRAAPVANKNQPRAWGAQACVYLGKSMTGNAQ